MNKQKTNELFPNFITIIECEFLEEDKLTGKIIEYYQNHVTHIDVSNLDELKFAKELDDTVWQYLEDYRFSKNFKNTLDIDVIVSNKFVHVKPFLEYMVQYYKEYKSTDKKPAVETRWI